MCPGELLPEDQEETVRLWRRLAESHERNRQFERARVIWKALLDRCPGDVYLQDRYAQTFTHGEDYAEAISAWMELIKQHPDIPELKTHMEHACYKQGQKEKRNKEMEEYRKDIKYWEDLHLRDPSNQLLSKSLREARKRLAYFISQSAQRTGAYHLAIPILEEIVAQYPKDEELRDQLLQLCIQGEDYAGEIKFLLSILMSGPYQPFLHEHLAYAYEKVGKKRLAIQTLKNVIASGHGQWDVHQSLYLMYRRCQDFEGLVQWRKEQLSKYPESQARRLELAEAYHLNRQFDEEIALFHQIIPNYKDGSEKYRHQLGLAYRGKQDHDAEIATFKSIVDDNPNAIESRRELAKAYQNAGAYTTAVEFLKRYLKSFCSDCKYLTAAFQCLGESGEVNGWRELMELHPTWEHLRAHLVEAYAKKGDHNSAILLLESLVAQQPSNLSLQRELATAYSGAPDFPERALAGWMSLVDKHPTYPSLLDQLAQIYVENCGHPAAIEGWRCLLSKHPDDTELQHCLATAYRTAKNYEMEASVLLQLLERNPQDWILRLDMERALKAAANPTITIECWMRMVEQTRLLHSSYSWEYAIFEDRLESAFFDVEEFDAAVTFWTTLIRLCPSNYESLYKRLQNVYEAKGDINGAISGWFDIVVSLLSSDLDHTHSLQIALSHLKKVYDSSGAADPDAISDSSHLLEVFPDNQELVKFLATLYEEKGDIDLTIKGWTDLLEVNPSSEGFAKQLESAYRRKGNYEAAVAGWRNLRNSHPECFGEELKRVEELKNEIAVEKWLKEVREFERNGHFREASRLWTRLVMQCPERGDWKCRLTQTIERLGDGDYAIQCWMTIISEGSCKMLEDLISYLSVAFRKKGDINAEIEGWKTLIPRSPVLFIPKLAMAYRKKGDLDLEIEGWGGLTRQYSGEGKYSKLASQLRSAERRRQLKAT